MATALTGCTATIGPYVSDIQELPDGRLLVVRCTTELTQSGQYVSVDNGKCTRKTIGRPQESK